MADGYKFVTDANYFSSNTRADGNTTIIIGSKDNLGSEHEHYNIAPNGKCTYARDANGKT